MRQKGLSLSESLVVLTLIAMALGASLPSVDRLRSAALLRAATHNFAVILQGLRWRSVASHRGHGIWFRRSGDRWRWVIVRDENGNGIRVRELGDGTDSILTEPRDASRTDDAIRFGIAGDGPHPRVPPGRGVLRPGDDPVRFGRGRLIAFTPLGTASSGSVYLTDRSGGMQAIVLFGPTARIRLWNYDRRGRRWRL